MSIDRNTLLAVAAIAAVGLGAVVLAKKAAANAGAIGEAAGTALVNAADGAVTGVVTTAGTMIGVPRTDKTQCEIDMANGDTWAASFSCPAGTFLTYIAADKIDPPGYTAPAPSKPSIQTVLTPNYDQTPGIY